MTTIVERCVSFAPEKVFEHIFALLNFNMHEDFFLTLKKKEVTCQLEYVEPVRKGWVLKTLILKLK